MVTLIMAGSAFARSDSATPWVLPVPGCPLPGWQNLLPNAPRGYRGGVHQGVDFFSRTDGSAVPCGSPVVSVCDGEVLRADHDWPVMSATEYEAVTAALRAAPDEAKLDRLRARQVRVKCADGTEVRYAHLDTVDRSLIPGCLIGRRDPVGTVGNTGTLEGSSGGPGTCHLHFEAWEDPGRFWGQGEPVPRARRRYAERFDVP